MTLKERLIDNPSADTKCYHCGVVLQILDTVFIWEDHQDGTYCSDKCVTEEAKMIEGLVSE